MPDKRLIVIGDGPDMAKIKSKAPANVTLLGYQSDSVLIDHLQQARAFIFAAEEDFGIIPVEAQACGTPVIAYGRGGALETVRGLSHPQPTGLFFESQTVSAIQQAVATFEYNHARFTESACTANAARFHPDHFKTSLTDFVNRKLAAQIVSPEPACYSRANLTIS